MVWGCGHGGVAWGCGRGLTRCDAVLEWLYLLWLVEGAVEAGTEGVGRSAGVKGQWHMAGMCTITCCHVQSVVHCQ